jgi:tetratricopeptide (TPR) repeat protein
MLNKEMTKSDIERELCRQGDYVKIDNITRFLKENPAFEIKKFLLYELIKIYEGRKMFCDAADSCSRLLELTENEKEKIELLMKQTEFYIKAGFFDKADMVLKRMIEEINPKERAKIMMNIKEFYKNQALSYENQKRKSKAIETYEKILTLNIDEKEKTEIENRLLVLYKDLGKVGEFIRLQKKLDRKI